MGVMARLRSTLVCVCGIVYWNDIVATRAVIRNIMALGRLPAACIGFRIRCRSRAVARCFVSLCRSRLLVLMYTYKYVYLCNATESPAVSRPTT